VTCTYDITSEKVTFTLLSGDPASPITILVVSDGFTSDERDLFQIACSSLVYRIENEPWYTIKLSSGSSSSSVGAENLAIWSAFVGAELSDDLMETPSGNDYPVGPPSIFGVALEDYNSADVEWLYTSKDECVDRVRDLFVAKFKIWPDKMSILVNYPVPAGKAHGFVALSTTGGMFEDIMLHEIGHTFGLRDEYGGDNLSGEVQAILNVKGINVTSDVNQPPWSVFTKLYAKGKVYPDAPDCTKSLEYSAPWNYLAAFTGGVGYHCGAYRASAQCKMRSYPNQFCLVCTYVIISELAGNLVPLVAR